MSLKMVHPEIEAAGEALDLEQFHAVHAPRGWELMDPATAYANEQLARFVRSSDDLTKDEARALIAHRGGEYPDSKASEDEVRKTYADLFKDGEPVAVASSESPTGVPLKPFDPSEYNADKVIAHLEKSDETERARVIAAEGADGGKQRKSVLEWTAPEPDETATAAEQNQE